MANEPINLIEYIQYSEGSVVSKTVVDRKPGTLTLFAFDAGQGLSEHSAPFDAIVQALDGEAEIVVGGEKKNVAAGQLIVMPANVPHSLRAVGRFKMMLIMIRA